MAITHVVTRMYNAMSILLDILTAFSKFLKQKQYTRHRVLVFNARKWYNCFYPSFIASGCWRHYVTVNFIA